MTHNFQILDLLIEKLISVLYAVWMGIKLYYYTFDTMSETPRFL